MDLDHPHEKIVHRDKKVMVLCATGKIGKNVCTALQESGFKVYGTTRSVRSSKIMAGKGIIPVLCDYTNPDDLKSALQATGCKRVFMITDFFQAAHKSVEREIEQGKRIVDTCIAAGCEQVIYSSVADPEPLLRFPTEGLSLLDSSPLNDDDATFMKSPVKHIIAKPIVERYLLQSHIKGAAVLRPVAFFENLDDKHNWNPLKKGQVKFLTDAKTKFCSTYDIGKAAALMFHHPTDWNRKTLEVVSWEGTLAEVAEALQKVSKTKTTSKLAMPYWVRWLFLNDLHHMCRYFEAGYPKSDASVETFKNFVPTALDAEGWFRFHGYYANGEPIDPANILDG
jgi:nucleoside-diphosphate-sugar epimerase